MWSIFRQAYKSTRGQIIGWGLALLVLGLIVMPAYDMVAANEENFQILLESYPPEVGAFFGDLSQMATPSGFIHLEFFSYMPLVVGIFALLLGSSLISSDEEAGRLDLVAAQPISRGTLFFGRVLAMVATTISIMALGWAGFLLGMNASTLDSNPFELLLPFLSLFSVAFLFASIALFLSQVLPSRSLAAMVTGVYLMIGYFVSALARLNEELEPLARISPMNYYEGGQALESFNAGWVAGFLTISTLLVLGGFLIFNRRDLRVAGEGTLRLAFWRGERAGRAKSA